MRWEGRKRIDGNSEMLNPTESKQNAIFIKYALILKSYTEVSS